MRSTIRMASWIRLAVVLTMLLSAAWLDAQYSAPVPPAALSVFVRAQDLAQKGSGAAARWLVDSVIAASPSDSPVYPEALYWRAQFAAAPADAESGTIATSSSIIPSPRVLAMRSLASGTSRWHAETGPRPKCTCSVSSPRIQKIPHEPRPDWISRGSCWTMVS